MAINSGRLADRIARMVVKRFLEPLVQPRFHGDSYGYRPGKSALDAVGAARQRCWRYAWVVDLDIKAFFDSIDTDLLMRAVRKHTDCPWALLYIERWLKAPMQTAEGSPHRTRTRDAAGRGRHSSNAKGNFCFDRVMPLDRSQVVLDLRLKR